MSDITTVVRVVNKHCTWVAQRGHAMMVARLQAARAWAELEMLSTELRDVLVSHGFMVSIRRNGVWDVYHDFFTKELDSIDRIVPADGVHVVKTPTHGLPRFYRCLVDLYQRAPPPGWDEWDETGSWRYVDASRLVAELHSVMGAIRRNFQMYGFRTRLIKRPDDRNHVLYVYHPALLKGGCDWSRVTREPSSQRSKRAARVAEIVRLRAARAEGSG